MKTLPFTKHPKRYLVHFIKNSIGVITSGAEVGGGLVLFEQMPSNVFTQVTLVEVGARGNKIVISDSLMIEGREALGGQ